VLVVDDSLFTVQTITRILEADPSIQVVGHALDGERALRAVATLRPDVITMDINMPRMDGIEATRRIVAEHGTPIVILSAFASTSSVALQTMQALMHGAIATVQKPSGEIGVDLDLVGSELIGKVKAASRARPAPARASRSRRDSDHGSSGLRSRECGSSIPGRPARVCRPEPWQAMPRGLARLIAIGVSTGGPSTLEQIIPKIPAGFPIPLALVIHMPEVFIPILASTLDAKSKIDVSVAEEGEQLRPGRLVIAPGGVHMSLTSDLRVKLERGSPVNGCVPSVDILFDSIAHNVRSRVLGLVLTGMGRDGASGLKAMRDKGDLTVAQDQATSVVYGMPRAASTSGAAAYEVSMSDVAALLCRGAGV
jgi:two-component system chemotaxis response regulator CheB